MDVKTDNAVSKNTTDDEISPSTVTPFGYASGQALSEAKGLSRWASRCFAALSMTVL